MIKSPNLMSLAEQAKLFREGKLTAVNNVKSHLEIINNLNPQLNSFITVDSKGALEQAKDLDKSMVIPSSPARYSPYDIFASNGMRL